MKPNLNAVRSASLAGSPGPKTPLRLQLDPNGPTEPCLDGAWWPRSTELPAELPALLAALSAHLGPIAFVGYHDDAWNAAPTHFDMEGHSVHLQGFSSPNPPTVVVIADSGRRVSLRVVPPETDRATAAQAMAAATRHAVDQDTRGPATKTKTADARSLDEVATRLARLPGTTDPQLAALISQWVAEAAAQFSDAPVQVFVPILVEHIVRGRMHNHRTDRSCCTR